MTPPSPAARETRDALSALDRRAFLRALGLAAGAGLLPSGCGGAPAVWAPPAGLRLRVLTPRSYAVLTAASERLVGGAGAQLVRARRADPAAAADAFLAATPELAAPLQQALLALEFGLPPFLAKWRPFTSLGPGERDAVLAELMGSRLALKRLLFNGVKSVAVLGFYAGDAGRDLAGYPRPGAPTPQIADAMRYPTDR